MAQPVFQQGLEEDLVQRVGTKLTLEVVVSAASDQEKVFFEWRGPAGSNAEDGRVVITEAGTTSRAEVTPLHLQVTCPDTMYNCTPSKSETVPTRLELETILRPFSAHNSHAQRM